MGGNSIAVFARSETTFCTKTNRQASRPKNSLNPGGRAFLEAQDRGPLERVLPDVVDIRHVEIDLRPRPAVRLVVELVLEVIHPHCPELGPSEIEDLMAGGRPFALKQVHLVGAVEMVLV